MSETALQDRRVHHKVRAVFAQACQLLAPHILNTGNQVSGFALTHMVRNHFPDLSDGDVHVLITTALRMRDQHRLKAVLDGVS
jgi:hypothetical protein